MAANRTAFRMMVSWDRAVQALDRAVQRNEHKYDVVEQDNGFLRLRAHGGVILDVEIRIESPSSTVIMVSGRRKRVDLHLPGHDRVREALGAFRDDVEMQLRGALTAA